jgi:hypothetical protein
VVVRGGHRVNGGLGGLRIGGASVLRALPRRRVAALPANIISGV